LEPEILRALAPEDRAALASIETLDALAPEERQALYNKIAGITWRAKLGWRRPDRVSKPRQRVEIAGWL